MRRSQVISLLIVVLVAAGALVGVILARWTPVLGVQLQGGVEVVLRPTSEVNDEQLDRAIEIIRSRVDALGVAEPDITRQGTQVVIQLPGVKDKQRAVDLVGQTAELRFRPVLDSFVLADEEAFAQSIEAVDGYNQGLDDFVATQLQGGEDGSDSEPEAGFETAEPESAAEDETADPETGSTETDNTDPGGFETTEPTVIAEEAEPDETELEETDEAELEGAETDEESTIEAGPSDTDTDESSTAETETSTEEAESEEVVVELAEPPPMLELTPPELDQPARAVLLADPDNIFGYALAPLVMTGEAVADAVATFQNEWAVNLNLTPEGSAEFDAVANAYFGQQVAIVLDGRVESAPVINAREFGGTAVITGNFTPEEAQDLALVLRFGALPVEFVQDDVRTVSATLGEGTLRAGVIAGIVGLLLVGVYMVFYYRMLGLVAVSSLAISGAILWSLISWLGESRGLALTLAGITGIIVSIGVQVDSNIVYYERIKEEVHRGRAIRSAADASFKPAFSTIVWADLASLIGAGVLYQLTSGTVRGFALYLGIATLIDLAVSYFFMQPLVVLVARKLVGENPGRLGMTLEDELQPAAAAVGGAAAGGASSGSAAASGSQPEVAGD